jgi:hypothetical protein
MSKIWKSLAVVVSVLLSGSLSMQTRDQVRRNLKLAGETKRSSQYDLMNAFRERRRLLEVQAQTSTEGASYVSIIPYVADDSNTRTNLGLNNFSQNSFTHGQNPTTSVVIFLFGQQGGNPLGSREYQVQANEMLQINTIFTELAGTTGVGWLLIYSDEPLTAWASVINNANNDPSIELAVADQIFKPAAFVESTGTRLLIQSSAKFGAFQSSLAVVNVGTGDGNLSVKIYDTKGNLLTTKTAFLPFNGMYVDNDIRSGVGNYGPMVIEVADTNPGDSHAPRLVANSLVRSTDGTSAFFPAFALPQANTISIAGRWEGTLSGGTVINAQVKIDLFQERDMLYGTFDIQSGGTFPTTDRAFLITGEVIDNNYVLQLQDIVDGDANQSLFSYRLLGVLSGTRLRGDTIYFDEQNRSAVGTFDLGRTGSIYD